MSFDPIPLTPAAESVTPNSRFAPIPVSGVGGSGGSAVDSINGQTGAVVLGAGDVGALTSDYEPAWSDLTGVPSTLTSAAAAGTASIRAIGTTATTAKAGNWTPAIADVTGLEARLTAIESRLDDLEV